ncbi:acetyl/propionyl/methylcrotonyl-CoA carboxylase subunit alpha [Noviherbaspirillum suwonense]|uniref:3-methylcrotonyl-CoA carboxylase alpha subunit n=1 Tax=Noviherbaspirillum suwonense TaxID=1224511 RepID=A0ABY1QRH3_9BURK|nr:biotin carboxylase N-terminal domain-containing protein [Noviherbaspirillum suwonense]SMP76598.1 3-methylcrotonyl-CoA carboxylase alpha subunit [Noviherbaspirillum suwonense]
MFDTLLIANRGEIACRIARTARRMGLRTVAVYSDVDRDALHVALCDTAVRIGPAEAARSYLDAEAILGAARSAGAQAIHPGYGFLSESLALIDACEAAGIVFVGPSRDAIRRMGSKIESKRIALECGVPVVPGYHGDEQDDATLSEAAARIGYPVLIKASAGGGGKGMRVVRAAADFPTALDTVRREAKAAFGDARVLLERYLAEPRHLEVQLLGDKHGHLVHLFERECSIQRNHQKVIEEAPAPHLAPAVREALFAHALTIGRAIGYDSAGTIEFIHDSGSGNTFFLEMNTRLQVEHPVTEMTVGLDLVEWQLRAAAGEPLGFGQSELSQHGCAIEARVCAENPAAAFAPEIGKLIGYREPSGEGVRIDSGVRAGSRVTLFYDSLLAKVIAHAEDRSTATRRLVAALDDTALLGVHGNLGFLSDLLRHRHFAQQLSTHYIGRAFPDGWKAREDDGLMIAAALHGVLAARADAGRSAWHSLGAWRMLGGAVGSGSTQVLLEDDGLRVNEATVWPMDERWRVRIAGVEQEFSATLAGNTLEVGRDGVTVRYTVAVEKHAVDGERLWLTGAGRTRTWRRLDRWQRALKGGAAAEERGGNRLLAPMPGMVTQVHVGVGAAVRAADILVQMEAMKMVHTLSAPAAGRVSELRCRVGDAVRGGDVLVVMESEEKQ